MRGRPRTKGPNPLTRSYESNGPDVKIRGTAQHIADKYAQLARDATASSDPVSAENYHQHAEHYYRLIAAAQEQYRQQFGVQQRPFDEDGEEGEDGEYGYGPDRVGQTNPMDEFADAPVQFDGRMNNPDRGGGQNGPNRFNDRGGQDRGQDRGPDRNGQQDRSRYDRNDRFDRQGGNNERFDRNARGPNDNRERFDRNSGQNGERFDRNDRGPNDNRGGERFDRNNGQNGERFDRNDRGPNDNRGGERVAAPERGERGPAEGRGERLDRNGQSGPAQNGERFERPAREGRPENGRRERNRDRFAAPAEDAPEPVAGAALPAFLTNPVRAPITVDEGERPAPASAGGYEAEASEDAPAPEPRARRTRRPRRTEQPEALDFSGHSDAEKPVE